ncbi:MAG TPA: GNAT family N-acetyltransferase [Ignavibacteria bacterium]|nr:GNAT family N-acetyltransferase [Ignavibacteria bacterium]
MRIKNSTLNIQPIRISDIDSLVKLQPPDWKEDIRQHFNYYYSSVFCDPIKITMDDNIVGVGTTLKHRNSAWLAHIIVHPEFRNRGIGKSITNALLRSLDKRKYKTVYLIATELGYPVYLKSGFEPESEYAHFEFESGLNIPVASPFVIPYEDKYKSEILKLDRDTTGEFREVILNGCIRSSFVFLVNGKVNGAYFPQLGDGLIIADDPSAGIELMKFRLQSESDAAFPVDNKAAYEFCCNIGSIHIKNSKRMRSGNARILHPEYLFNRIGGQLG